MQVLYANMKAHAQELRCACHGMISMNPIARHGRQNCTKLSLLRIIKNRTLRTISTNYVAQEGLGWKTQDNLTEDTSK